MDTVVILNLLIAALIGAAWSQKRCYVCSGKFPDRDCELYPQYVTMGPGKVNCTMKYCTVIARYKPKKYLLTMSKDKKLTSTARPLTHMDFELDSIARECENLGRGSACKTDSNDLGITCYSQCTEDLCNKDVPKPTEYSASGRPARPLKELEESYEENDIETIPKNQRNDDLPESYADYDSMKPNGVDYGDRFPPPLKNDTEIPPDMRPPMDNATPPDQDMGPPEGKRPGRRGPPPNYDVSEYEGQGAENGGSTIDIFKPLFLLVVLGLFKH